MTLTDHFRAALARLGSASHPIAREIPGIVATHARHARAVFLLAVVIAFAAGFLLCYGWAIVRLDAIGERMDGIYLSCLNPVIATTTSKAQAQVVTRKIEERKEREP